MKKRAIIVLSLFAVLIAGCASDPISGSGSVIIGSKAVFLLPPEHPGNLVGNTLNLPEQDPLPSVRTAYCFPGVDAPGAFGIGSLVGDATVAVLPVNINSGSTIIGSYSITVTSSNPAVALDRVGVRGSNADFALGTCIVRGCPQGCQSPSAAPYFPNLYTRAPGFEGAPTVSGDSITVTVSATDSGPTPASGIFNLALIPIRVVGTVPYGGVDVLFTVNYLRDAGGNPVAFTPVADGLVIKNFHIVP